MNAVYSLADKKIPIVIGQLPNPVLFGACRIAIEGAGAKVERGRQEIIEVISEQLDDHDWELLKELYQYDGPVPINKHEGGYYSKDRLRTLRNHGLVRTLGVSFRVSDGVEITNLGKIAIEEALRANLQG